MTFCKRNYPQLTYVFMHDKIIHISQVPLHFRLKSIKSAADSAPPLSHITSYTPSTPKWLLVILSQQFWIKLASEDFWLSTFCILCPFSVAWVPKKSVPAEGPVLPPVICLLFNGVLFATFSPSCWRTTCCWPPARAASSMCVLSYPPHLGAINFIRNLWARHALETIRVLKKSR